MLLEPTILLKECVEHRRSWMGSGRGIYCVKSHQRINSTQETLYLHLDSTASTEQAACHHGIFLMKRFISWSYPYSKQGWSTKVLWAMKKLWNNYGAGSKIATTSNLDSRRLHQPTWNAWSLLASHYFGKCLTLKNAGLISPVGCWVWLYYSNDDINMVISFSPDNVITKKTSNYQNQKDTFVSLGADPQEFRQLTNAWNVQLASE